MPKLTNGHIWASCLEQEVGVIGRPHGDVSAYVIDRRGGEAVCSAPMCLSESNRKYRSSFLDMLTVYCH